MFKWVYINSKHQHNGFLSSVYVWIAALIFNMEFDCQFMIFHHVYAKMDTDITNTKKSVNYHVLCTIMQFKIKY